MSQKQSRGSRIQKIGRPKQQHLSNTIRGIVSNVQYDPDRYEEAQGNEGMLCELIFQQPLQLKCISNTIK